ncbi:MAG TPA: YbjN domain-containing protein [Actinocrinis sp.]|uniref:YbjN domain-containing protein n=1 Tax=Actinocrinis sp. TaxID=1920516 RepID=UPI002DDD3AEF|nr:YbjN domain-containing protein [Actinocrinis sp.]HEV2344837.1 YbjN domain-containing protein [Actinocrinis sp.]
MTDSAGERARAIAVIETALAEVEAVYERPGDGHFVVSLPGSHKLSTTCSLLVGDHTLSVNAFVVRAADENHEAVYRWLLEHNARLSGIAFALDRLGDVFLVGRVPLSAVTEAEVDRLLGSVLDAADANFDRLLELGFAGSIRREWAWRLKRGESTANLAAFERLRPDPDADSARPAEP